MKTLVSSPLSLRTTFKVGGKARFFVLAENTEELKQAIKLAEHDKVPWLILGEGSNVLVSDDGFDGVVIKSSSDKIEFKESGECLAEAGAHWDNIVAEAVARNFAGIENLSGIPGSAGAAPIQNIGAYGGEISQTLVWVEVFDIKSKKNIRLSREECSFGYRDSFFKHEGKHLIVTKICLKLKPNGKANASYKDLTAYFKNLKNEPNISDVRKAVLNIRAKKLPDLKKYGTAGSFFKNPIIEKALYDELKLIFPELPGYSAANGKIKVSAAWIIDNICGRKGNRVGNVGTYKNQSLVIINYGNASAKEIFSFAEIIKNEVKEKTKIILEWEVCPIGF